MLDGIGVAPVISTGFGIAVLWVIAWAMITRKIVWHTDLDDAKKEIAEWKAIVLRGIGVTETLVEAAEVTTEALTSFKPTGGSETPS